MGPHFRASAPLSSEVRRVFVELLGEIHENLTQLHDDRDRRIHECRKGLKRARAYLALVEPGLTREVVRRERRVFRDLGKALADARERRVLREVGEREIVAMALPDSEREALLQGLHDCIPMPDAESIGSEATLAEAQAELSAALERVPEWTSELSEWSCVARGFAKTYRRARKRMKGAADGGGGEDFHDWREAVKHHTYHCDVLREAWPKRLTARHEALSVLAAVLGDAHDLFDLGCRLDAEGVLAPALEEHLTVQRSALEDSALDLGQPLFRRSASRWKKRLRKRLRGFSAPQEDGAVAEDGTVAEE